MAGAGFTIQVDDGDVRATLAQMAQDGTGDLMPHLGEYLLQTTEERFTSQTAPDGSQWKPLRQRYARRKRYNRDKILTLRGYLRSGIRYQPDGPLAVEVGTNSPYGAIHQFGGTIVMTARQAIVRTRSVAGRILFARKNAAGAKVRKVSIGAHEVNMPARAYLGVSSKDRLGIVEIVRTWLKARSGT